MARKATVRLPKSPSVSTLLRAGAGLAELPDINPASTPGFTAGKTAGIAATTAMETGLATLQEKLFAASIAGDTRRVLLVLQGMDTSGKGGTLKHVVGYLNPAGVTVTAFKAPTDEERQHDFLWRIRSHLPNAGQIAVFDRSHYEDVLIARVRNLVPKSVWSRRFATINRFEQRLADDGVRLIKVMLHISAAEQKERLIARLADPAKHWKYNPTDIDERARWDDYQTAYADAVSRCGTPVAPWYVVPADRKWYRNWAVTSLVREALADLNPQYPPADFDVAAERRRARDC
jgi:PPK2 family polyphosphate:nucleotide phosphotransferase